MAYDPILLVDDDRTILRLLEFELMSEGFNVVTARNGEEFRSKALSGKPSLIVLDIMLGTENGALIYNELLLNGLDRQIPVIFLTALAEDRPSSPASPGHTYALYSKPFDSERLVREIHALVG